MKEIVFLDKGQVLQLHRNAINDFGGIILLRDEGLLDSAIAQPKATFGNEYLHETIFLMAAAYFFHISQNQPFSDGNKRTGLLCMYAFLFANGYDLSASNEEMYPELIDVAEGRKTKQNLAVFIEEHSTEIP